MSHPAFLTLKTITCHATEDFTGADDIPGIMGGDRFAIGQFNAGDTRDVGIERAITPGVTELTIVEQDLLDPDDVLITIDLTQEMDVDRAVTISAGSARYDILLEVTSESD